MGSSAAGIRSVVLIDVAISAGIDASVAATHVMCVACSTYTVVTAHTATACQRKPHRPQRGLKE
jgi:hypothetical protein